MHPIGKKLNVLAQRENFDHDLHSTLCQIPFLTNFFVRFKFVNALQLNASCTIVHNGDQETKHSQEMLACPKPSSSASRLLLQENHVRLCHFSLYTCRDYIRRYRWTLKKCCGAVSLQDFEAMFLKTFILVLSRFVDYCQYSMRKTCMRA